MANIVSRLARSVGHGVSRARAAETSSSTFQAGMAGAVAACPDLRDGLLDRLLTLLNWTLSEFTLAAQVPCLLPPVWLIRCDPALSFHPGCIVCFLGVEQIMPRMALS